MICRQNNQCPVQSDLLINISKEVCQCSVKLQNIILALQARRAEEVTDIVGDREADPKKIGDVIIAKPLLVDQRLCKIGCDLVPGGAQGQEGCKVLFL